MGVSARHFSPAEGKRNASSVILCFLIVFIGGYLAFMPVAQGNWQPLTERLIADGFDEQRLWMLFARPEVQFDPEVMAGKVSLLVKRHQEAAPSSGPLNHNDVHQRFLNRRVIAKARSFLLSNRKILKEVSASYCVPEEIVVSILLVETRLGRNTGRSIVFNRLASMASCRDLDTVRSYLGPTLTSADEDYARTVCRQKADWAYNELKALLHYARGQDVDPVGIKGSVYGAIGMCQFMPSNVFAYGVDADNDGRVDPFGTSDAIHSIANYLHKHGWNCQVNREGKRKAVFAYNNSTVYVNTVLAVADKIKSRSRSYKQ